MNEEVDQPNARRSAVRPWVAGMALVLGATTALACGSSSDDKGADAKTKAAATTAAQAAPAPTQAAPEPTAQQKEAVKEADQDPNTLSKKGQAYTDSGLRRILLVRLGTPGSFKLSPAGKLDKYSHWYKPGTQVTITAENGKAAKFAEWAGTCTGKQRTCKVKVSGVERIFGGFVIDEAAAKSLSPDDPALQGGVGG
jgi:hypothetical protein